MALQELNCVARNKKPPLSGFLFSQILFPRRKMKAHVRDKGGDENGDPGYP